MKHTVFVVPGAPVPKARPRVTRYGTYTPKSTRDYEKRIVAAWRAAGAVQFPAGVPLSVTVYARFPIPKRAGKSKRAAMEGDWHTVHRGDADNVVKAVQDALNGHAYPDDCAVCKIYAEKLWSSTPGTTIIIQTVEREEGEHG